MKMSVRVAMTVFILLLGLPSVALADGGATLILIIGIGSLILGAIGIFMTWLGWQESPTIPVCEEISFKESKREGEDRRCTYVKEGTEYHVMLSALKRDNPNYKGDGCPDVIHPKTERGGGNDN